MIRDNPCALACGVRRLPHCGKLIVRSKSQVREFGDFKVFRRDRAEAFSDGSRRANVFFQSGVQLNHDVVHRKLVCLVVRQVFDVVGHRIAILHNRRSQKLAEGGG